MMEMMHNGCRCFHHIVKKVLMVLAGLSGIGFFVVVFRRVALFGWSADLYFMSAIVLVIIANATKMCGCWKRHEGMGGHCEHCGMGGKDMHMGGMDKMAM